MTTVTCTNKSCTSKGDVRFALTFKVGKSRRPLTDTKRDMIPASGYYEWQDTPDGKQPYYFTRRDGGPLTIAGLWDAWHDKQAGETVKSCAMVITDANKFVGEVHDRMPVILEADEFEPWLSGTAGAELLKPAANDVLQRWPGRSG
jgi:putative SOS response-associated peptidase YedK